MVKKAVVAAAGEGTRMLHLTNNKSKHLIEVKKRPFLAYLLDNLFKAGFREIILVVGYRADLIEDFLKKYRPPQKSLRKSQYTIKTVNQYDILGPKKKMYGTACPLMCVEKKVGKSQFIYLCGDNLYSIRDLKAMRKGGKYSYVAGIYHKTPQKYGVLVEEKGFLKEIVEKPKKFMGNIINAGLYKFTSDIFKKLGKINKSPRGEYEITDAINLLAREKKVKVIRIKDIWLDFGNPADIIKLSYFVKSLRKFKKLFWRNKRFEVVSEKSRNVVSAASDFIKRGQVVASPTDTVYGLLADAASEKAVEKVYRIKGRDKKKPLPVFVKDIKTAKKLAHIDKDQEEFLKEVWPGRTTVVLKKKGRNGVSKKVTANKKTIALRIPDYKLVKEILKEVNRPLTGTSANISGRGYFIKIKEVLREFEKEEIRPDLIIDGGNLAKTSPSIIVDLTKKKPKILRK